LSRLNSDDDELACKRLVDSDLILPLMARKMLPEVIALGLTVHAFGPPLYYGRSRSFKPGIPGSTTIMRTAGYAVRSNLSVADAPSSWQSWRAPWVARVPESVPRARKQSTQRSPSQLICFVEIRHFLARVFGQ
jgi:hypothetical protein